MKHICILCCAEFPKNCSGKHCAECTEETKPFKIENISHNTEAPQIATFKEYYDYGAGRQITSKRQETEICKRENKVMGGYHELRQEARKNKQANEQKLIDKTINQVVETAINRGLIND